MRFTWAKGERTCRYCKQKIERGHQQIHITVRPERTKRGYWLHYYYHFRCYVQYMEDFIQSWFQARPNTQKKLGRKKADTYDRKKRRQLMALYRYYRKKGDLIRMDEINGRIRELSYGASPYPPLLYHDENLVPVDITVSDGA